MHADTVRRQLCLGHIDVLDVTALFSQGRLTPLALAEACLQAAKKSENVFITLTEQRALAEAAASSERWKARKPLSALDGVPIDWKDLFDLAGTVTTAGSATRRQAASATEDAPVVARLTQAGMVNIGKTNLSEFAFSGLGLNAAFGTPAIKNQQGERCAPGGSSSGSARAVAEGLACIAMGTDTAGSIRIPAAFSGITGFRASRQRYDATAVFPLSASLDTTGPLCRSVREALALDTLLTGETACMGEKPHFRVDPDLLNGVHADVRAQICRKLDQMVAQGFILEWKPVRAFHQALAWIDENGWPGAWEAWQLHAALLASPAAEKMDPLIRSRLQESGRINPSTLSRFLTQRSAWQNAMRAELNGSILITPTVAHTAPRLAPLEADATLFAQTNRATLRLTMPGSLLDMPGVTLPCGVDSNGLATSLLFSLPDGDDRRLLMAAQAAADIFAADKPAAPAVF